jgi:hypothetical protein
MHSHSIDQWTHDHVFLGSRHHQHERRAWFVRIRPIPPDSASGSRSEAETRTRLTIRDGWFLSVKSTTPRSD